MDRYRGNERFRRHPRRGYRAGPDYDRGYHYGRDYNRGLRPEPRYGAEFGRYLTPFPGDAGYPSARWGWGPIGWAGWGGGMDLWPYAYPPDYGYDGGVQTPRRSPRESPAYGRGGDRALRRWAARYGYDLEYEIRPRRR